MTKITVPIVEFGAHENADKVIHAGVYEETGIHVIRINQLKACVPFGLRGKEMAEMAEAIPNYTVAELHFMPKSGKESLRCVIRALKALLDYWEKEDRK